jgi:hypothetical protein
VLGIDDHRERLMSLKDLAAKIEDSSLSRIIQTSGWHWSYTPRPDCPLSSAAV